MRHGGLTQRPGTGYVGTTLNAGSAVRLVPFIFNETGTGQSYVLEFGDGYIAFYQNGALIQSSPGVPYTVSTPYPEAVLSTLNFAQCADILTIVHPLFPPKELIRNAPTNWTLSTIVFGPRISGPSPVTESGGGVGTQIIFYVVSAVNAHGIESDLGGGGTVYNINPSPANPVQLSWPGVPGAVSYRVYAGIPGGALGFLGTTQALVFFDTGITPDYANPPVIQTGNPFPSPGNYPSAVGFVQQRRCFGPTLNNPVGLWMSITGDFYNFNYHLNSQDSDAIITSLFGEEVNSIEHILELRSMLVLTAGAELFVQGNGSGVVTPSAINAATQSQYGSSALRPLKVGDVLIFNQALGSFIRDFSFDFVIDGYRGNDITVFSAHLFEGYQIVDWAYQKTPDSIIWAVRSDGVLLSCTYVREQQILAWARHDFKNGFVENVVSIPENGNYAVYVVIKRVINGATVRYVERLSSRIWTDPINATYLDCFLGFDGRNTGSTTMTASVSGSFDQSNAAYQQALTLTASAAFFNSGMVGNQIFLQDAAFVSSQGSQGNQIRFTIATYVSSTVVTVYANRAVPAEFQNIGTTNWSRAVKSVSGLSHLEGQSVSIWADRFVVGSPLNLSVSGKYTVSGGALTLDKCYSVIYVGLPMINDFETLDIDTSFGESILDQPKNITRVIVYLRNARSFFAGAQNPDTDPDNLSGGVVQDYLYNLVEQQDDENRLTYDAAPQLQTDPAFVNVKSNWSKGGRIFIRNVDPIPLSILAVIPAGLTAAKIPYSQKV